MKPKTLSTSDKENAQKVHKPKQKNTKHKVQHKSAKSDSNGRPLANGTLTNNHRDGPTNHGTAQPEGRQIKGNKNEKNQNESGGIMKYLFGRSSKKNASVSLTSISAAAAVAAAAAAAGETSSGAGGAGTTATVTTKKIKKIEDGFEREQEWWPVDTLSSRQKRQIQKQATNSVAQPN